MMTFVQEISTCTKETERLFVGVVFLGKDVEITHYHVQYSVFCPSSGVGVLKLAGATANTKSLQNGVITRMPRPFRIIEQEPVAPSGQSCQSGNYFEKPGAVQLKLLTAAKPCRRPGEEDMQPWLNPTDAQAQLADPGETRQIPWQRVLLA